MSWSFAGDCLGLSEIGDDPGEHEQHYCGGGGTTDHGYMRDERASHDNGKQDGRMEGIAGNQQADAGRHFQNSGEIAEPLAEADLGEQFDHDSGTGQLGAAGPYKGQGDEHGKSPESDEAALAGGGWELVCRYHEVLFPRSLLNYIDVNILDVNSMMLMDAERTQRNARQ